MSPFNGQVQIYTATSCSDYSIQSQGLLLYRLFSILCVCYLGFNCPLNTPALKDGVLLRGPNVLPAAKRALNILEGNNPYRKCARQFQSTYSLLTLL